MPTQPHKIFVTGIGTGVGKTIASAVLAEALQADYWKPIQCGNLEDSDSLMVKSLILNPVTRIHPESYRLRTASSPHYASKAEDIKIDLAKCIQPDTKGSLIIEGAGGLMVPLNENECVVDLIVALQVPVVLVCRNYLGSINHTLLSIALLKQRGIPLLGLIFSGGNFLDNEEIIRHFGQTKILGRIDEGVIVDKEFIQRQAEKIKMYFL